MPLLFYFCSLAKHIYILFLALLCSVSSYQQTLFKVIVPSDPVTVGQYFQVQYVVEEGSKKDEFTIPVFNNLQIINGPALTTSSSTTTPALRRLRTYVFTLMADKPGRYLLPSAVATVNGIAVKSNSDYVYVTANSNVARQAAGDIYLRYGEDPYKKMKANLFIRVAVSKKQCYTGEPVVATYKLYSRLDSKSDIVKNPGFYGFTVQDMENLNDHILTTEMVNGKPFDVHTIRKVQLYPLRAGNFTIDEMEVANHVVFSKSYVNKKTEQEIEEGVYDHPDAIDAPNTEVFENSMHTEPIGIEVKEPPLIARPTNYSGATGKFSINASLQNNKLSSGNEGHLIVTISGKGNFTQLSPPVIDWPLGIEGFDAIVTDQLDKTQAPFPGNRTFNFPFVVSKSGTYSIPPVTFSYFNPDTNTYSSLATKALTLSSSNFHRPALLPAIKERLANGYTLPVIVIVLLVMSMLLGYFLLMRKKQVPVVMKPSLSSINSILASAGSQVNNIKFYTELRKAVDQYLAERFNVVQTGSDAVAERLTASKIPGILQDQLLAIINECEVASYTAVDTANDKDELLRSAERLLSEIDKLV